MNFQFQILIIYNIHFNIINIFYFNYTFYKIKNKFNILIYEANHHNIRLGRYNFP